MLGWISGGLSSTEGQWLDSVVLGVLSNLNDSIPAADSELLQLTEQILWKH